MGDLVRSGGDDQSIIQAKPELRLKHLRIQLHEKETQFDAITVRIDALRKVEIEQLELQQYILQEHVARIKVEIRELAREMGGDTPKIIDAEFEVMDDR